ncbi:hypothetical protein H6F87_26065 [Cyanobacteria bacterium FACHB-502]|nr:hypothetical protein [Cyanobacteria bacterium FACHB-502]
MPYRALVNGSVALALSRSTALILLLLLRKAIDEQVSIAFRCQLRKLISSVPSPARASTGANVSSNKRSPH